MAAFSAHVPTWPRIPSIFKASSRRISGSSSNPCYRARSRRTHRPAHGKSEDRLPGRRPGPLAFRRGTYHGRGRRPWPPNPAILLDEPFAGIDPLSVADLQLIISDKERGLGVLISDHNVRETLAVLRHRLYCQQRQPHPGARQRDGRRLRGRLRRGVFPAAGSGEISGHGLELRQNLKLSQQLVMTPPAATGHQAAPLSGWNWPPPCRGWNEMHSGGGARPVPGAGGRRG